MRLRKGLNSNHFKRTSKMVKLYTDKKTGKTYTAMQLRALYKAEKIKYESSEDYATQTEPFPSIFKFKLDNFIQQPKFDLKVNKRILKNVIEKNNNINFRALVVDTRTCKIINKFIGTKQFIFDSYDKMLETHPDALWLELIHEEKNNYWKSFNKYF